MHNGQSAQSADPRLLLYDRLKRSFSLEELRQLCFECRIDNEQIAGSTKSERSRELILYFERRDAIPQLLAILRKHRPRVTWPNLVSQPIDPLDTAAARTPFGETHTAYLDYLITRHSGARLPMSVSARLRLTDLFVLPHLQRNTLPTSGTSYDHDHTLTFGAIVQAHSRLMILGQSGSGKSTLLQFLALRHALALKAEGNLDLQTDVGEKYEPVKLPFLIDLAHAAHGMANAHLPSLFDFMCQSLKPDLIHADDFESWLKTALHEGRAILLLDGFDRALNMMPQRVAFLHALDEFLASIHPDNRVVITSRAQTNVAVPALFAAVTICELDGIQMRRFMTQWLTAISTQPTSKTETDHAQDSQIKKRVSSLLNATRKMPALRRLAKTPGHLALLMIHALKSQMLPRHRTALVRYLLNTCLDNEATHKLFLTIDGLGKVVCLRALSKIALWMLDEQRNGISEDQAIAQIHELLANDRDLALSNMTAQAHAQSVLKHIISHAGLLTISNSTSYSVIYEFAFPLLQEYLAAHDLLWRKDALPQIKKHRADPLWQDVIVMTVGQACANDPTLAQHLIQEAILETDASLASRKNLLLAAYCLGECDKGINAHWLSSVAQALIAMWASADHDADLAEAIATLFIAASGSEFSRYIATSLIERVSEANEGWQIRIMDALGKLGYSDSKINHVMLASLAQSSNAVRQATAKALGLLSLHTPAVIQALATALSDSTLTVRRAAIQSLGYLALPGDGVQSQLTACLDDPKLCNASAEALTTILGADETLMRDAIERLHDAQTRTGGLALLRYLAVLDPVFVERRVESLIHDPSHEIRKSAIWLIQRLGLASDGIVDALLARLRDDKVRRSAAEALVRIAHKNRQRIVDGVEQISHSSDKYVQGIARDVLARVKLTTLFV